MRGPQVVKNIALIVIVVLVGSLLRTIDSLATVDVWRWRLGELVTWASFAVAATAAAVTANQLGEPGSRVVGSAGLSRLTWCVFAGVALWLLSKAVRPVLVAAWRDTSETVFALVLVALAVYAIWIVYGQFEDITAAMRRFQAPAAAPATAAPRASAAPNPHPAATAPSPAAPSAAAARFCGQCGAPLGAGIMFCQRCGADNRPAGGGT